MIISRTPLRVSFFGGGTDFKDYYDREYGCVLSTSINRYIYVMVNHRFDNRIQLNYRLAETVDSVDQIFHPTIREAMRLAKIEDSTELTNMSDVHAHGTGLGSSSSFVVGMLNALYTYQGESVSPEKLARDACKVEIDILREPIGKQDQYVAAYGGLNFIRFSKDERVSVERIKLNEDAIKAFQSKFLFFYTGITRKSSQVLRSQKDNIETKLEVLGRMRRLTENMRGKLSAGKFDGFGEALMESWEAKRSLAEGISNPLIDDYYQKAIDAGAAGGKILGAGGGGFFMFYCDEEKQASVRKALGNLRELKFAFSPKGSEIVYSDENEKVW